MEFSRQEYWSGLPFPSPGDLSNPGIEPGSPALQADALPSEPPVKPYKESKSLSLVWLYVTSWTVAYRAPPSMGFSMQECWSGLPCPSPGDLADPGLNSSLPHCKQTLYRLSHQESPHVRDRKGDLFRQSIVGKCEEIWAGVVWKWAQLWEMRFIWNVLVEEI